MNKEAWFTLVKSKTGSKYQINGSVIFSDFECDIFKKINDEANINEVIEWITQCTIDEFVNQTGSVPKMGAVNNIRGQWNERIIMTQLCEIALEVGARENRCIALFSLPSSTIRVNSSRNIPRFLELFTQSALSRIQDCISSIFFPSPDCVITVIENSDLKSEAQRLMQKQLTDLDTSRAFKYFKQKLDFSEVKSVISFKTSNRPDRRYQPSFEAAMIKALAKRIGQPWRYYMVTNEYNAADTILFEKLGAPHTIDAGTPEKLVNELFLYERRSDLIRLIEAAIL